MLPALLEESGPTHRLLRRHRRLTVGVLVALCTSFLVACGGGERQDADEPEGEFPVEIVSAEFPPKQRLAQTTDLTLTVANVGDETVPDLAITVFTEADADADEADPEAADPSSDDAEEGASEGDTIGTNPSEEENLGSAVDQALQEELENGSDDSTGDEESGEEESGEEAASADTTTDQEFPQADGAFSVISQQEGLAIPSRPVWILEQGYPRIAGSESGNPPPGELSGAGGAEAAQTNTFSFGALDPNETTEVVFQVTPVQAGNFTVNYRIAAGLQGKAVAINEDGSIPEGEFVVRISDIPPQTRVDDAGNVVPIEKGDIIGQAGTSEQKSELDGQ